MLNIHVANRQLTISTLPKKVVALNEMLSQLNALYRINPMSKPISTQIYVKKQLHKDIRYLKQMAISVHEGRGFKIKENVSPLRTICT
jgi:hypothetical protein